LIEHGLTSPPTQYRLYGRRATLDFCHKVKIISALERYKQRSAFHTAYRNKRMTTRSDVT